MIGRSLWAHQGGFSSALPEDKPLSPLHQGLLCLSLLGVLLLGFLGDPDHTFVGHLMDMGADLELAHGGQLWIPAPELGQTNLHPGLPFFFYLHLPARLLRDPILGLHLLYALYQLLSLVLFLVLALRSGLPQAVVWVAVLLLAAASVPRSTILENSVLAAHLATISFALLLLALTRSRAHWSLGAGAAMAVTSQLHLLTLFFAIAVAPAFLSLESHRWRRLAAYLAGLSLAALGLLAPLFAPSPAYHPPAPAAPELVSSLLVALRSFGFIPALLEPFLFFGLIPLGVLLALTSLRHKAQRALYLAVLLWVSSAFIMAFVAGSQEVALGGVAGLLHKQVLLKPRLLAGPATALLIGLGLRFLMTVPGRVAPARVGRVLTQPGLLLGGTAAGALLFSAMRLTQPSAGPPAEPEPFLRSASRLQAASAHIQPLLEAGLDQRGLSEVTFTCLDPVARLLVYWRIPTFHVDGSQGETLMIPAGQGALETRASFQAGAWLGFDGLVPLSLELCQPGTEEEFWCAASPGPGPEPALLLLQRKGQERTLVPKNGQSPLPGTAMIAELHWPPEYGRHGDFEWLVLEPGPNANGSLSAPFKIRSAPPVDPVNHTPRSRIPTHHYSLVFEPELRAWYLPGPREPR